MYVQSPEISLQNSGHPHMCVPSLLIPSSGFSSPRKLAHGSPRASSLGHVPTLRTGGSALPKGTTCLDALLHSCYRENPHSDVT